MNSPKNSIRKSRQGNNLINIRKLKVNTNAYNYENEGFS